MPGPPGCRREESADFGTGRQGRGRHRGLRREPRRAAWRHDRGVECLLYHQLPGTGCQVLHENLGIVKGLMTTIHAYTNDQVLTDVRHKDLRRARSATQSMIPTKTGAAAQRLVVLPELNGKLDGFAVRVPTINVSMVDLSVMVARAIPPRTK